MDIVLKELFTTDIGLLALFTIGFAIAIGLYLSWWFKTKMNRDE